MAAMPIAAQGAQSVSYIALFKYADAQDVVLVALGTLGAVVNGLTFPAMLIIRGHMINNFGTLQKNTSRMSSKISQDSLFFVYVAVVALVASYLGERQAAKLRTIYLRAILRQDVAYFDNEVSASDVVNSVSRDTLLVQEAISEKAGNFIRNTTQFLGGYLVGFTQSWKLSIAILPFTPFLILPGILYGKAISDFEHRKQVTYSQAGSITEQATSSIRTVYSFVGEKRALKAYSESLQATVELGLRLGLTKGLALGSNGISFVLWSFMAWYGSVLIMHGEANGGEIITTGLALLNGGRSLGFAMSNVNIFVEGRMAAWRIFQVIKRVPPIDVNRPEGQTLTNVEGRLSLKEIVFSYPSRCVPILRNFTLDIPAGKTTALVGSSGSGKSTVISLLERFYDPVGGHVLLDGVDIKALQLKWYRRQIGLVSQEPALFAMSIKENILYGKEDASMAEVIEAAKSASAHDFIVKFPKGYETLVGERGIKMSGGQKQRIAIARAMIKKPPILLLDEATSALDMESETLVQAAIEKASVARTTLVIAHRLSTIRNADLIAVVESGKIVQLGTHEDLVSKGKTGAYKALIHLQKSFNIDSGDGKKHGLGGLMRKIGSSSSHVKTEAGRKHSTQRLSKPQRPSFWHLLSLCTPEWRQGLLGLAGAVGFGVVHPMYAFLLGCMVSVYYTDDHGEMKRKVGFYCSIFPVMMGASFLVNIEQHCNFAAVGEYLTKRIRERMLAAILKFEVGWFDNDENCSSAICARLSYDANIIRALITDRIYLLVQTASAVSVSLIIGLVLNWRLGILMTGTQPLFVFCYYIKLVCLKGFTQKTARAHKEASQVASEAVSHHRTITAFSSQDRVLTLLKSKQDVSVADARKRSHMAGFGLGIAHFVLYASWGLQFWYGGVLVKQGKTSYQNVFKIFFVFLSTGRVIAEALGLTPDLAKGAAAIDSVFSILQRKTDIDADDQHAASPGKIQGVIELCSVYFAYPSRPDIMILRDFSLQVPAGQTVALVGHSGSGKSTVIGLIERFYDPPSGQLKIDGRDIKALHLQSLRQQIGLVSQEPTLFAATIQENIAYGREECTEVEVVEAAHIANAHNFISALPNGYKTHVGERGIRVSGGQKQRIAIARAVLKSPAILLLDEATSALDTESEHLVQGALQRMMVGRTTVVVAHRLSTIKNCHQIVVVQNGAVVEQGTHEELLSIRGAYFSLVYLQTAGEGLP